MKSGLNIIIKKPPYLAMPKCHLFAEPRHYLPKNWDKNEFQFTIHLPNIRPYPWHFSINIGLDRKDKNKFCIHAHWTLEKPNKFHEPPVLYICFSLKELATVLSDPNIESYFNKLVNNLQQNIPKLLIQNHQIFNILSQRNNFFLFYCGAIYNEKLMLQQLFNYFPYEERKKQLTLETKLTPQARRYLIENLINPNQRTFSKPGFYTCFLTHPKTQQPFDIGYINIEKVNDNLIGFFFLKHQIPIFGFNYLTVPFINIIDNMLDLLIKMDSLSVKWHDKVVSKDKIKEFTKGYLLNARRNTLETIIAAGLEGYFWCKGYKFKFKPGYKWGVPLFVSYIGNERILGVLAYKPIEIEQRVKDIIIFRKKYKAKRCIFITPDKTQTKKILFEYGIKNITILPLDTKIFVRMFYASLRIRCVKKSDH